eukprot:TRINITY_DN8550_c0_g1_i1.p1 TRINITY_DN8550_c0_g1~~TRINITY_DN8550_c0_g1_i1.p1  ORF type:complete len:556 (-),score=118.22 TRINITY_DN8550_c0_g1_i1:67-1734(-)
MVTGTISKLIIRPGRSQYVLAELGPPEFDFGRNKRRIKRVDFQVKNARGLMIEVSVFEPVQRVQDAKDGEIPAIIYLHGNIGSRRDALQNIDFVLSYDMYYVCFDFTGSGLSEGKYISLGYYEQEDTHCVIKHLKENFPKLGKIGLWGRSMGASTAILYAGQHGECVDMLILDSPFSNLYQVASELIEHKAHIPKFLAPNVAKISLQLLREKIIKKAEFDIKRVSPIDVVRNCKMPALFVSAHKDDIVAPTHSKQLCEQYSGEHKLVMVEGDHNTFRTSTFFNEASVIIFNNLLPDEQKAGLGEPISVFGKSLPKQDCQCFLLQWVPPLPDEEKKQISLLDKREEIVKEHHKDKKGNKTKGKGKEKEKEKVKVKGKKKQILAYPRQMVMGICADGLIIIQLPYSETVVTSFPLVALRSYSLLEDNMWFALQMKDDYEDVSHLADSKRVIVFNGVEAEAASKALSEQLEALLWQQSGLENGGQGGDNSDIIEKIENCVFKLMESKDKMKEKKLVEVIKEVLAPVVTQRNMDSKAFSALVETTVHKAIQEYKQKQKS